MAKRLFVLFLGTSLGGWLGAHLQFGISGYWGLGSDELSLVAFVAVLAALVVSFMYPLSRLAERKLAVRVSSWVVFAGGVVVSLSLGVWFYLGLLGRSVALVFERDWPFILCFSLLGVGYAIAFRLHPSA